MQLIHTAKRALAPCTGLVLGLSLIACSEVASSGTAAAPTAAAASPTARATGNGIHITAVGTFSDQAEDANGQREDGCSLNFIVDNRSDQSFKSFSGSFKVFKVSSGASLNKHFPLVLTQLAAGSSQTSPPDLIHGARCEDMKVVISRSTCRQETAVACPSLQYTAQGLAAVEVTPR